MRIEVGDFVIARVGERKKALVRALERTSSKEDFPLKACLANEYSFTKEKEKVEIEREDVLCNLGDDIEEGASAFGVKIQPFRETINVKGWGPIQIFRSLSPKEKDSLVRSLKITGIKLKNRRLNGFMPLTQFNIFPKSGKYAGMYRWHTVNGDTLDLFPEEFDKETSGYIYHEAGHGIFWRMLSPKQQLLWYKFFHKCVRLTKADVSTIVKLGKNFSDFAGTAKDFRAALSDAQAMIFDECLGWLMYNHKIDKRTLDLMKEEGEPIVPYWPKDTLFLSDVEELISEYATKNHREFFCEAFRFYMTGKKMPVVVRKYLKKTLKRAGAKL